MIKKNIEKVLMQAEKGVVEIGEKENQGIYKVRFYANINGKKKENVDDRYLVVDIPDYNLFLNKVEKYLDKAMAFYKKDQEYFGLSERAYIQRLFLFLMMNVSVNDASNIYDYIDQRTKMLETPLEKESFALAEISYKKALSTQDVWVGGSIMKNRSSLEGPYKFSMMCINRYGEQFNLPAVTFGIAGNTAYVYAVQNTKVKQDSLLAKELDRYFRKVGKGVDQEDIISNVSPNALVALTMFNAYLKKNGVEKVVAKDFLPLRYMASVDTKGKEEEDLEKIDRDQTNITDKFMYLFLRYGHHFPSSNATYDDVKGEMELSLCGEDEQGDNIIYQMHDAVFGKLPKNREPEENTI